MEFVIFVTVLINIVFTGLILGFLMPILPKKPKEDNVIINLPQKKRSPIMVNEVEAERRNKNGHIVEL
ncbi:MAG: hypothetical protein KA413_00235 [Candidatus Methylopumilus sp.]|nr:hypothetical protein [Candidatus Methylopumilus sp.]